MKFIITATLTTKFQKELKEIKLEYVKESRLFVKYLTYYLFFSDKKPVAMVKPFNSPEKKSTPSASGGGDLLGDILSRQSSTLKASSNKLERPQRQEVYSKPQVSSSSEDSPLKPISTRYIFR